MGTQVMCIKDSSTDLGLRSFILKSCNLDHMDLVFLVKEKGFLFALACFFPLLLYLNFLLKNIQTQVRMT